ncbi:MAG TPA: hypothetical protein VGL38_09845 [bacterium]|jgi:uncharacterized membrane protein
MKPWFLIGLGASLLYGVSAVLFKLLTSEKYLNGHSGWVLAGIGMGIVVCGFFGVLVWPAAASSGQIVTPVLWAIPIGFLNGFATLLILYAMRSPGTNISQLVPVYNTNTLVAFLLAVIFFKELPTGGDLVRNLGGALLIVLGTTLIGMR